MTVLTGMMAGALLMLGGLQEWPLPGLVDGLLGLGLAAVACVLDGRRSDL